MIHWSEMKVILLVIFLLIRFILGCCSNFLIAISTEFFKSQSSLECSFALIPNERIAFSNKLLNELANLDLSEIISPFLPRIFSEKVVTLSDKNGLTVFYRSSCPDVFCKKVFLEISQNSQENTCARVSFLIKLQACLQLY